VGYSFDIPGYVVVRIRHVEKGGGGLGEEMGLYDKFLECLYIELYKRLVKRTR
jgi:hypothetical protein